MKILVVGSKRSIGKDEKRCAEFDKRAAEFDGAGKTWFERNLPFYQSLPELQSIPMLSFWPGLLFSNMPPELIDRAYRNLR